MIGDRNKFVQLQRPVKVPDGQGGTTTTYVNVTDGEWVSIWPITASERLNLDSTRGEVTHRIKLNYRRGIGTDWRIKLGNRYFTIEGLPMNRNETNKGLEILAKEGS